VQSFSGSSANAEPTIGGLPSENVSAERYAYTVAIGTTAGVVIGGTIKPAGTIVSGDLPPENGSVFKESLSG